MDFSPILNKLSINKNGDIGITLDNGEHIILPLSVEPITKRKYLQVGDVILYHDFIVANIFIPNPKPDKYTRVEHIDGNMENDNKENLRWIE